MHLVACHAGHRRFIGKVGASDVPRSGGVLRLHKIADCATEMHAMAAEAIVHQTALGVVRGIGEDLRVGGAVRTCVPGCVFMLMAILAVCGHREDVGVAQTDGLWRPREEMDANVPQLGGKARFVTIETRGGTVRGSVDGGCVCGHLVAACTTLSALRSVVIRGAIDASDAEERNACEQKCESLEQAHHERNAVPFQLRTSASDA